MLAPAASADPIGQVIVPGGGPDAPYYQDVCFDLKDTCGPDSNALFAAGVVVGPAQACVQSVLTHPLC